MNRRELITLLGGAAVAWPFVAFAQKSARVWRIGWLSSGSGLGDSTRAFLRGMRERGYIEGQNLAIEYRWAGGNDAQLDRFATELVRNRVDLIVTSGTPATLAAKHATRTVPII